MLRETKLSISTSTKILSQLERLGTVDDLAPDHLILAKGDEPDFLYVILEGVVLIQDHHPEKCRADALLSIGSGDLFGEIGFFLGLPRTCYAIAGPRGCKVWKVSAKLLSDEHDVETTMLLAHLLIALGPHINLRLCCVAGLEANGLSYTQGTLLDPDEQGLIKELKYDCDFDHPAIQSLARLMKRGDDWANAANVWDFVSRLPFRFGHWNRCASQTLAVGFGNNLTKANLQVALLRALGLDAGFVYAKVPSSFYAPLQHGGYQRPKGRKLPDELHHFCAVKLDNKWVHCDASFTREALKLMARAEPGFERFLNRSFGRNQPFSLLEAVGRISSEGDLEKDLVAENLGGFINVETQESMNLLLDRVQGSHYHIPMWISATRQLLKYNPRAAFHKAFGCISYDLATFHELVRKRNGPS